MTQPLETAPTQQAGRFDQAQRYFDRLDADTVSRLITAAADVVLAVLSLPQAAATIRVMRSHSGWITILPCPANTFA